MSDEPVLPSLRLRPRQPASPDASVPPAPTTEAGIAPEADSPLNDPLKLRLKPKAPPPEGSPADTSGITFSTPAPFSEPPIPPATTPTPAPALPPAAAAVPPLVPLPPIPPPPFSPPKPQYVPTPLDVDDPAGPASGKSSPPAIKADKWLAATVLFALVLAGGFIGIRYLTKAHPKPNARAAAPAPTAAPSPQPSPSKNASKLVDNPTSMAGKAVAKARDLVAAQEKLEKEQGVTSILEEPATTPPTGPAVAPVPGPQASVAAEPAAPAQPAAPPPPSDAFKLFVVNLRVNGVFQGDNPRAMLNGKMYHLGDPVDVKLGIMLYQIDVEAKQIIFHDADGASVSRHY